MWWLSTVNLKWLYTTHWILENLAYMRKYTWRELFTLNIPKNPFGSQSCANYNMQKPIATYASNAETFVTKVVILDIGGDSYWDSDGQERFFLVEIPSGMPCLIHYHNLEKKLTNLEIMRFYILQGVFTNNTIKLINR